MICKFLLSSLNYLGWAIEAVESWIVVVVVVVVCLCQNLSKVEVKKF